MAEGKGGEATPECHKNDEMRSENPKSQDPNSVEGVGEGFSGSFRVHDHSPDLPCWIESGTDRRPGVVGYTTALTNKYHLRDDPNNIDGLRIKPQKAKERPDF